MAALLVCLFVDAGVRSEGVCGVNLGVKVGFVLMAKSVFHISHRNLESACHAYIHAPSVRVRPALALGQEKRY